MHTRRSSRPSKILIICLLLLLVLPGQPQPSHYMELANPYLAPESDPMFRIRVLTANVGNSTWRCRRYLYNLCYRDVEERIALGIARLQPDVIALQELTDPAQCKEFVERDSRKVCYRFQERRPFYQVRRLVGPDYTIVCDSRNRYECIAIHTRVGTIEGCELGEFCEGGAVTDVPQPGCDTGFTVSSAVVVVHGQRVTVVNAHLQNSSVECREWALRQVFEDIDGRLPLASGERILLLGDFNLDPFKSDDASVRLWRRYVGMPGEGKPFWYHSGPAERQPPHPTVSVYFLRSKTVDFVVSNFAYGTCVTLGETPDTTRLDAGRGMDHRALFGELCFSLE